MDSYKAIYTNQQLKKECEDVQREIKTPLAQARETIKRIQTKRDSFKLEPLTNEEWLDLDENKIYAEIAHNYHLEKLKLAKERRAAKKKKNKL